MDSLRQDTPADVAPGNAHYTTPVECWNNGTAIFVGISLAVLLLFAGSFWAYRHGIWGIAVENAPKPNAPVAVVIPLVPAETALLRVTSLSLGQTPLAVVGGREVAAGEFLRLKTSRGIFLVRVDEIYDGGVSMSYGDQIIRAKLDPILPPPRQPHA